jgi:large subunit ribosomal protein L21
VVYARVKAGGRQEKVAVGDLIVVDRVPGAPGSTYELPAVLFVEDGKVTTDVAALAKVTVTAEVIDHHRGVKIDILKFKNKTGYRRRQGHRSELTKVKVTNIAAGK